MWWHLRIKGETTCSYRGGNCCLCYITDTASSWGNFLPTTFDLFLKLKVLVFIWNEVLPLSSVRYLHFFSSSLVLHVVCADCSVVMLSPKIGSKLVPFEWNYKNKLSDTGFTSFCKSINKVIPAKNRNRCQLQNTTYTTYMMCFKNWHLCSINVGMEGKGFKTMMYTPDRGPWHPQRLPKDQWRSRASSLSQVSEVL